MSEKRIDDIKEVQGFTNCNFVSCKILVVSSRVQVNILDMEGMEGRWI